MLKNKEKVVLFLRNWYFLYIRGGINDVFGNIICDERSTLQNKGAVLTNTTPIYIYLHNYIST